MKATVEKRKKEFQKTIDKSQNLMYNKYIKVERSLVGEIPRPSLKLTDGVAVVT